MTRVLVLYNPDSRNGEKVRALLCPYLADNERGAEVEWTSLLEPQTTGNDFSKLIVVGGDGTVNAGVSFLLERDLDVPLGIVPAGTGNNLCSGLGLPSDPVEAFRLALSSKKVRALDVVRIDCSDIERAVYMVQTSALGFPARICEQYDRLRRRRLFRGMGGTLGPAIYRLLALAGLASQKYREKRGIDLLEMVCRFPEGEIRETAIAALVGNERSTGGDFIPCPQALPDDGLIDLCVLKAGTGVSYLKVFGDVAKGTHVGKYEAVFYQQTRGPLEIELSRPSPLLVDGDLPVTSASYRYSVLPGRLRVLSPDGP